MPAKGLEWLPRKELMTFEEMLRLCSLLVNMGIEKIRITGGEPFVRKDLMQLLTTLSGLNGLHQLTITTNGVLTAPFVPELKKLGINSINLSLDTLDRDRFVDIAHRDELSKVLKTLEQLLLYNMDVKINTVVMENKNIEDIISLVELTKNLHISVRFIEEMPFNGEGKHSTVLFWDHTRILNRIKEKFPDIQKIPDSISSTSYNYHIPGFMGDIGIIAAYSRTFCGTCNRIRITPIGTLKTCLYDNGVLNIKDLMRKGYDDDTLKTFLVDAMNKRAKDGWEVEKNRSGKMPVHESMATIGG
jgi:cyclic pyranopterin phosphate synthase